MAKAQTQQPPKVDAPVEAFRFAADFTPGEAAGDGTVPFTSLARTADVVESWYFGRCVHDFAGMSVAPIITVDYNHCDDEALGLINTTSVTPDGLQCSGVLTPFLSDDKATEVIFKAGKGVPYQASIFFNPWNCVIEDVPAGFTADVNGQTVDGPVAVFRQWELLRLAICLSGVDGGTNVGFSKNLSGATAAVTRFTKGKEMSTKTAAKPANSAGKFADGTTEETDDAKKKADAEAAGENSEKPAEGSTEEESTESDSESESEDDVTKKKEGDSDTKMSRKDLGKKFVTAFGDVHGPKLFTSGFSFSQAETEFTKILQAENKKLREDNAKFAKGEKPGSGTTPVSFGGTDKPVVPTKFAHMGNIGRLAAGIKMPGK